MNEKIKYINKNKYVDYSDLPIFRINKIDWKNTVGKIVICNYYGKEYRFTIKEYYKDNQYVLVDYNNKEIVTKTKTLMGCEIGRIIGKITIEFKHEIGEVVKDEKRNFTIIDNFYTTNSRGIKEKYYKYHCNHCSYEGEIKEGNLENGRGCPCCSNKIVVRGINDIATTNPEMIKYFVNEEDIYTHTAGSGDRALVKCPHCGFVKDMEISNVKLYGVSCPNCSDGFSYPNKFLAELCKQLKEMSLINNYKLEWSPNYLEGRRNDCCITLLDSSIIVIEMDGGLGHKGGKVHSFSKKSLEECINIDTWKEEQNMLHGIKTIRIDSSESSIEYIKNNILKSELNTILNLTNIDWEKCGEVAVNNLCKEICRYRNENKEASNTDIGKVFGISQDTVLKYVKLGNELGWCNYDIKNPIKTFTKTCKKRIKIVEANLEYDSLKECVKNMEKDLGITIHASSIIRGMKANRKVKGYTFIYI